MSDNPPVITADAVATRQLMRLERRLAVAGHLVDGEHMVYRQSLARMPSPNLCMTILAAFNQCGALNAWNWPVPFEGRGARIHLLTDLESARAVEDADVRRRATNYAQRVHIAFDWIEHSVRQALATMEVLRVMDGAVVDWLRQANRFASEIDKRAYAGLVDGLAASSETGQ